MEDLDWNVSVIGVELLMGLNVVVAALAAYTLRLIRRHRGFDLPLSVQLFHADVVTAMGMRAILWSAMGIAMLIDPDLDFTSGVIFVVMARSTTLMFLAWSVGDLALLARRILFYWGRHPGQRGPHGAVSTQEQTQADVQRVMTQTPIGGDAP